MKAPVADVFRVLANGWLYAQWVVGTRRVLAVDPGWPRPGARFTHEVGTGPLKTRDQTECLEVEPLCRIVLRAKAWPSGEARVTIILKPEDDGTTRVTFEEVPTRGPARLGVLPGLRALLKLRNRIGLLRLRELVEPVGAAPA